MDGKSFQVRQKGLISQQYNLCNQGKFVSIFLTPQLGGRPFGEILRMIDIRLPSANNNTWLTLSPVDREIWGVGVFKLT